LQDMSWSPDGKWLAYALDEAVYLVRSDGSGLRRLAGVEALTLAWSPDGSTIAFGRLHKGRLNSRVALIDVRSGTERDLVQGPAVSYAPAWSPDGKELAFLGCRPGRVECDDGSA